jgi:hypothetical protein
MHPLSRLLGGASLAVGLALLMPGSDDLRVQATHSPVAPEWTLQQPSNHADNPAARRVEANLATKTRVSEVYGRLPLSFEKNEGQTDSRVEFLSRGPGRALFLSAAGEAVLALTGTGSAAPGAPDTRGPVNGPRRGTSLSNTMAKGKTARDIGAVLRLKLVGASRKAHAEGREKLPGTVNYLLGKDRSQWHAGISTYARVAYENVYPGVDLVYYGNRRQLEYDFILRPGVDPRVIAIEAEGADRLEVDERGDLVMHVGNRQVRQQKPVVYQEVEGVRQELDGRYALQDSGRVTFQLGAYDPTLALVIDPVLVYSTYLGGGLPDNDASDFAADVAVDAAGQAYVVGYTLSSAFSTSPRAFRTVPDGSADVFVTKLNDAGTSMVYSTVFGGGGNDYGQGIAVDAAGAAYITGFTYSSDFPAPPGAYDSSYDGKADVFVTKLDAAGATLAYSTYLGGANDDAGQGIAVDAAGEAYVAGYTYSSEFPATAGASHAIFNDFANAFVTKLDGAGTTLVYSTVAGGARDDIGICIAVDAAGHAYVIGYTSSSDFPTTSGAYDTGFHGNFDVFVAKLEANGRTFAYSTFLGGADDDIGQGIAVDLAGGAYVTGYTTSSDFPASSDAHDMVHNGKFDVFVTKLEASGATLTYSTFLGGADDDIGQGIAVNAAGEAYITGYTSSSSGFPWTAGAYDESSSGGADVFVTKLDATGATLVYSTFLGGTDNDFGQGIAIDGKGGVYVTGYTSSSDFPTPPGAYDTSFNLPTEAFVTKIDDAAPPPPRPVTLVLAPRGAVNIVGQTYCVTAMVTDSSGDPVAGVTVRFAVPGDNADNGFAVTDATGEARFCYTGTHAGLDTLSAFADTNNDQIYDADTEPADLVEKTYLSGAPAALILTPAAGTDTVGARHCVMAMVRDSFGNPTPNVTVRFTVTGAVNTGGSALTDANGQASFCYTGPPLPGADAISAYADTDNDNSPDVGEPGGAATETWVSRPLACADVDGFGYLTVAGHPAGFAFDVDQDSKGTVDGELGYLAWGRKLFRATEITRVTVTGQSATIDGVGSEYGVSPAVPLPFRVEVTVGQPDKFKIAWPGYAAEGSVTGHIDISTTCGHDNHDNDDDVHHHHDRGNH